MQPFEPHFLKYFWSPMTVPTRRHQFGRLIYYHYTNKAILLLASNLVIPF